jgi:hypothetical protein
MIARVREMRDWPWTERAYTIVGAIMMLGTLIVSAFLEGLFR